MSVIADVQPLRVMLVEHDKDVQDLFSDILVAMGYTVKCANTSAETLVLASRFRPDAVFMPITIDDHNGFQLCAKLRQMPETAAALIVAVTGYSKQSGEVFSKMVGFDHYLMKPVPLDKFLGVMKNLKGYRGNTISNWI